MPSLKRHDGELMIDNRAAGTPAIPGMPGFGNYAELPTMGCAHCGGVVVINPLRTRERAYCRKCDRYICDGCSLVTQKPGYEHRSFAELSDMVTSGRYTIIGGTACEPILAPVNPSIILGV